MADDRLLMWNSELTAFNLKGIYVFITYVFIYEFADFQSSLLHLILI